MKILITNAGKVFEVESTDDPRVINQLAKEGKINPKRDTELTFYDSSIKVEIGEGDDITRWDKHGHQGYYVTININYKPEFCTHGRYGDALNFEDAVKSIKLTAKASKLIAKFKSQCN